MKQRGLWTRGLQTGQTIVTAALRGAMSLEIWRQARGRGKRPWGTLMVRSGDEVTTQQRRREHRYVAVILVTRRVRQEHGLRRRGR